MPQYSIRSALLFVALLAALSMAPVAPEAGNIVYLATGVAGILLLRTVDRVTFVRPIVWMPLAGIFLVVVAYGASSRSTEAAFLGVLLFSPFIVTGPLLALARTETRPQTVVPQPVVLALLAITGVAGAAAVATGEFITTGTPRAGESVANPIHFADVALAAGFLATLGVVYARGAARYLFLLGPILATIAVLLSGTRGAVVALLTMAAVSIVLSVVMRRIPRRIFVAGALTALAVMAVALIGGIAQSSGIQRVLADIVSVQQNGLPTDTSTALRLQFYEGGLKAFLASPIVGHGPLAFTEVAGRLASVPFTGVPHLHNDIADFAASGGALGLVAYLLFLFAPLVEAIRAPESSFRAGLIIVTASLTVGYFVMGLTNAMFGILTITVFYSAIGVVVGLASGQSHPTALEGSQA